MKNPILQALNISYGYQDKPLFSDISFDLAESEILQIAGENGKGKTTLLRLLCGLLQPFKGDVHWENHSIFKQSESYQTQLTYLAYQIALKQHLTIEENLKFAAQLKGCNLQENNLDNLFNLLNLNGKNKIFSHKLSAGQKRRVGLATLLIAPSKLWILDEPLSGLDKAGQALLKDLIQNHLKNKGVVIFTSHHWVDLGTIPIKKLEL